MEIKLHLGATNASRHGVPEVVVYDVSDPLLSEIKALRAQTGWTWNMWRELIRRNDVEASAALVWLAARRNGCATTWDEFELRMADVRYEYPEHVVLDEAGKPVEDGMGKAVETPPGDSTNATS